MTYGRVRLTTRGRGNCFDTMAEEGGVGDEEEQPPEEAEDDGAEFFESSAVCVVPIEVPTDEECLAEAVTEEESPVGSRGSGGGGVGGLFVACILTRDKEALQCVRAPLKDARMIRSADVTPVGGCKLTLLA